ncbi:MAG: TatD family hydrolase, partial [Bacteroidales bacterium]|nr:TatD family hydrolase [Bacteroidales bacterium]
MLIDAHTHQADSHIGVISVEPDRFDPRPGLYYSVGIHPWSTLTVGDDDFRLLEAAARHPQVVAIGECGIDRLRGADIDRQRIIFERHVVLSESLRKPLIVHEVKASDIILSVHARLNPVCRWMRHGARFGVRQAEQYVRHGIYLGFGAIRNEQTLQSVPQ